MSLPHERTKRQKKATVVFQEPLKGSCLCGRLKYRVESIDSSQMAHCHCSDCRKFHGAAFSTFLETSIPSFTWIDTNPDNIQSYVGSNDARRQFCKHCGSSLTFCPQSSQNFDCIEIAIATLDEDSQMKLFEIARPDAHLFCNSKVPWYDLNDSLPKFSRSRTSLRYNSAGLQATDTLIP
jgi:hypothetical protein